MKKTIFCIIFLFVPQLINATLLPINFTGETAQLYDSPGYYNYGTPVYDLDGHFGGAAAMNVQGQASQFTVTQRTFIQSSLLDFCVYDFDGGDDPAISLMADFTFIIYDQTINHEYWGVIPDSQIKHMSSNSITLYGEGNHLDVASGVLDFWINPGTYWVAFEGGASRGVCYGSNLRMDGYTAVPEPASMLLLGFGLPLIYMKRRNRVS
jgi:hypothetical protein